MENCPFAAIYRVRRDSCLRVVVLECRSIGEKSATARPACIFAGGLAGEYIWKLRRYIFPVAHENT